MNEAIKAVNLLGAGIRAVGAVQRLWQIAMDLTTASQVAESGAETSKLAVQGTQIAATETQTAVNYGLAASFEAINAAMGPIGWIALAGGLLAGAAVGYGAAGGFGGGAPAGAGAETTNIYMGNVSMQTRQDAEATATALASLYHQQRRRYGR